MAELVSILVVSAHLLAKRDGRQSRLVRRLTSGQRLDVLVTAICVVVIALAVTTFQLLRG